MEDLLVKLLPLMIGSAISPGVFALAIATAGSKNHPYRKTLAYFTGALIVAIAFCVLAWFSGDNDAWSATSYSTVMKWIDIIIGLVLLYFGIKSLLPKKEKKDSKPSSLKNLISKMSNEPTFFAWMMVGFLFMLTNLDNGLIYFGALREIARSNLSDTSKILPSIIAMLFFLSPIIIPLLFLILFPKSMQKMLDPVIAFLNRYARYIIAVLLVVFGAYLIWHGLM